MARGVALVTGASAGIGEATVRALVDDGWDVHMTARRAPRLSALAAETGAHPHVIDAADAGGMTGLVASEAFDLVVANAGAGAAMTAVTDASPQDIADLVSLNVTAVLQLIGAVLPGMVARRRGHVVTVGSVAGLYPTGATLYGATKHAVRGMARNLRLETLGTGVRFTDIQPGRVRTEFYDVAVKDPEQRQTLKETGIDELAPRDVAEAIRWVAAQPAHVNIAALEIAPTDQAFGGARFPA